jgi:uncharacterized protein YqjF (DUF2071 family)
MFRWYDGNNNNANAPTNIIRALNCSLIHASILLHFHHGLFFRNKSTAAGVQILVARLLFGLVQEWSNLCLILQGIMWTSIRLQQLWLLKILLAFQGSISWCVQCSTNCTILQPWKACFCPQNLFAECCCSLFMLFLPVARYLVG